MASLTISSLYRDAAAEARRLGVDHVNIRGLVGDAVAAILGFPVLTEDLDLSTRRRVLEQVRTLSALSQSEAL
jgi:hypothetical protein